MKKEDDDKIEDSKLLFTIVVVMIIFNMIAISYMTMQPFIDPYIKSLFKNKNTLKKDDYKKMIYKISKYLNSKNR